MTSPGSDEFWYSRYYVSGPYSPKGNRISCAYNGDSISAWDYATGNGVRVAVVDQFFNNPGEEIWGNTQLYGANAGSAWVYDVWNGDGGINEGSGHGRQMASLIFSRFDDSASTHGVANGAYPALIHADMNSWSGIANGIGLAQSWSGVKIINVSAGGYYPSWACTWLPVYSPVVQAKDKGIIVVGAAGNGGDGSFYPAHYWEALAVGAHDYYGNVAVWSWGRSNSQDIDIWAAGYGVVANGTSYPNIGASSIDLGTSGATAIVSGALALLVERGRVWDLSSAVSHLRNDAWWDMGRPILDVYWGVRP